MKKFPLILSILFALSTILVIPQSYSMDAQQKQERKQQKAMKKQQKKPQKQQKKQMKKSQKQQKKAAKRM